MYPNTVTNSSVYARSPAPNVSEKYQFIPTYRVIERFQEEGFEVATITQKNVRAPHSVGFGEHMVRMRQPGEAVVNGELVPEVIIINSHNRSKALRIGLGFFRFVCSNGLITGEFLMDTGRLKHIGNNMAERVLEYLEHHSRNVSEKIRKITDMKTYYLNPDERSRFAYQAGQIVNPNIDRVGHLLLPNRYEDQGNNVWTVFQTVQENAMKGAFEVNGANRVRKARPIKNIDRNVQVNAKLWDLAESFVN